MVLPTLYTQKAVTTKHVVYTREPVEWGTSTGKGTGFFTKKTPSISYPVYDPSRAGLTTPRTRPRVAPMPYDHNGGNGDDGIPSKFTSPYFWTGRDGIEGAEPSVPSREQFTGTGGLFGEPTVAESEEGLAFGEEKEGFDWGLILLIGGLILLLIIVAVF